MVAPEICNALEPTDGLAHSAAHVPRIRNETEGSFRVTEVVPNLGLHSCSRITIEGLNEASYSADACSEREPEIV
jgi:hypothetical protein